MAFADDDGIIFTGVSDAVSSRSEVINTVLTEAQERLDVEQRGMAEMMGPGLFDPIPFGAEAARVYGRLVAAVVMVGRHPRRRIADLMIAATAVAEGLALYTTNPADFNGLETHLQVVAVTRPRVPHDPGEVG